MNLQSNYELRLERRALRDKVAEITPLGLRLSGVGVTSIAEIVAARTESVHPSIDAVEE